MRAELEQKSTELILELPGQDPVPLRAVQLRCLEILDVFDDFCRRHHLQYSLCGGCCIGALRHGGFIPWDDDVDVHMPRRDYERLTELWPQEQGLARYQLCRTGPGAFYDTMLTAIVDTETCFVKRGQEKLDIPHGLRLEVIPLDGAPEGRWARRRQLIWALLFYLYNREFAPENRGALAAVLGRIALVLAPFRSWRTRLWQLAERRMSRYQAEETGYWTELCVTWKYMRQRYPYAVFAGTREEDFEGRKLPLPVQAEAYLQQAFGAYMELPPEEQRRPKHEALLLDPDQSYRVYQDRLELLRQTASAERDEKG